MRNYFVIAALVILMLPVSGPLYFARAVGGVSIANAAESDFQKRVEQIDPMVLTPEGREAAYEPATSAYISANAPRQFSFSSQPALLAHWFNSGKGNGQR